MPGGLRPSVKKGERKGGEGEEKYVVMARVCGCRRWKGGVGSFSFPCPGLFFPLSSAHRSPGGEFGGMGRVACPVRRPSFFTPDSDSKSPVFRWKIKVSCLLCHEEIDVFHLFIAGIGVPGESPWGVVAPGLGEASCAFGGACRCGAGVSEPRGVGGVS